ncbi:MAG: FHIPEP family type III secretion protein, partial [Sphingopyxis sp.]
VPALLLSIAAASIVTRVNSPLDLAGQISGQFASSRAWAPVGAILAIIGILPGMPHLIILPAAAGAGYFAWNLRKKEQIAAIPPPPEAPPAPILSNIGWDEVSEDSAITLQLGFALVGLVDERKDAPLMTRITGIRRQLSRELGFVIPLVRVRDDLGLSPNAYRISIGGVVLGEDEVWPEDLLALDSGDLVGKVDGREAKDPTFGLDALWIPPSRRAEAVVAGYTVVDSATVVATHLNRIILSSAADLFGMDEAQKLLDVLKETTPQLVSNLTPAPLPLATIAALCRDLLSEHVPLKDFRRIAEAMADAARTESDPALLVEAVRRTIGALIVQTIVNVRDALPVITLDSALESLLAQAVRTGREASHPVEPGLAQRIIEALMAIAGPLQSDGQSFAMVTSPLAR